MRKILFRGKSKGNGEWVYGSLLTDTGGNASIALITRPGQNTILEPVMPETVCQYTGIDDADGKKVFEGDIVRVSSDSDYGENEICHVEFLLQKYDYPGFDLVPNECESNYFSHISLTSEYSMEVIGNIHDNPELSEGEDEQ